MFTNNSVSGIFLKILGKAYCHWNEGSGDTARSHTGEEIFINEKLYVAGSKSGIQIQITRNMTIENNSIHFIRAFDLCTRRIYVSVRLGFAC